MGDRTPRGSAIDDLRGPSTTSMVFALMQTEPPPPPPKSTGADSLEERFNRLRIGGIKLRESRATDYFTVHSSESSYSTPSLSSSVSSNPSKQNGASSSIVAIKHHSIPPTTYSTSRKPLHGPRELPTTTSASSYESNRSHESKSNGLNTAQLLGSLPSVPKALPSVPSSSSIMSEHEMRRSSPMKSSSSLRNSPSHTPPPPTIRPPPPPPIVPPPPPPANQGKSYRSYNFPRALSVTAETLATYIHEVPDQILLLDIRPREQFDEGHIYASNIVSIDPIVLRANQTSADLEDALILSPAREQDIFSRRHKFELVIYYDQNSRTNNYLGGPVSDSQQVPLHNLIDTIYEHETVKSLKRQPCLLVGGIDAWVEYCGRNSLVSTKTATNVAKTKLPDKAGNDEVYDVTKDKITMTYEQDYSSLTRKPVPEPYDQRLKRTPPIKYSTIDGNRSSSESSPSNHNYNSSTSHNMVRGPPQSAVTAEVYNRDMNDFFRRGPHAPSDLMPQRPTPVVDRLSYNGRMSAHSMPVAGTALPSLQLQVSNDQPPRTSPQTIDLAAQFPQSPTVTRSEKQHSIGNNYSGLGEVSAGLTGLKNLGNTCYMNSIIQCLAGTGLLARFFLTGSYKKHINLKNKLGTKGELTLVFGNLVHALYNDQCTFLIPTTMKEVAGRLRPEFSGNDQHDAQEFLTFILDGLHEDLNVNGGKARLPPLTEQEERMREQYTVRYASFLEWERYMKSDNSAIVHMFQGQYQSRLTCTICRFTSTTYNPFSFLSLPLAPGKNVTLEQCFDLFVAEEVLDHDDAWHCPQCKQQRKATKALRISRLPVILIIHLKRFKVSGRWSNKLENFVNFPLKGLDLTPYWPNYRSEDKVWLDKFPQSADQQPPFHYNLYGVVNHYGSVRGGHYTAFVHKNNKGWLIFDDSRVAICPPERVVSKDAYVLFYERDLSRGYASTT
ncbi:hypothetical protein V1504DRAFT_431785 [Lipomyces starkeyi]